MRCTVGCERKAEPQVVIQSEKLYSFIHLWKRGEGGKSQLFSPLWVILLKVKQGYSIHYKEGSLLTNSICILLQIPSQLLNPPGETKFNFFVLFILVLKHGEKYFSNWRKIKILMIWQI